MRVDTLSYTHTMKSELGAVYQAVLSEQLSYFKRQDPSISALAEGTSITCDLVTKTQSSTGVIMQSYDFREKDGKVQVTYSEKNIFEQSRNQFGFMLVGLLYKYFYNRGIRRRLDYLDGVAGHLM